MSGPPHYELAETSLVAGAVLETPLVSASADFYSALMGWEREGADTDCLLRGPDGMATAGVISAATARWIPIFTIPGGDAGLDVACERAVTHGARLDTAWLGDRAVRVTDRWGNVFGLVGALVPEPDLDALAPWLGMVDLGVAEREAPVAMYRDVLGVRPVEIPHFDYMLLCRDVRPIAGLWAPDGDFACELWDPLGAGWLVEFAVLDCDRSVSLAVELGAQVTVPTTESPVGSFATFRDPWGVPFGVCVRNPDSERMANASPEGAAHS